jgi:hypothetical protein
MGALVRADHPSEALHVQREQLAIDDILMRCELAVAEVPLALRDGSMGTPPSNSPTARP